MSAPNETRGVTGNCPYWTAEEQLMHDRNALREVANTAREEGYIQGLLEARMESQIAEKEAMAIELNIEGLPIEKIAKITKLPLEQVQSIIEEYERHKGTSK